MAMLVELITSAVGSIFYYKRLALDPGLVLFPAQLGRACMYYYYMCARNAQNFILLTYKSN